LKVRNKILIAFLIIFLIDFGVFNYVGPRMIIKVNNLFYKALRLKNRNAPGPSDYGLHAESINYISADGLKLSALLIRTDSVTQKGTVLLVHGMRSSKEKFLPVSKLLADNGFNSVIPDLRAHGQSEGKYCTFGYKEKQDLSILMDSLQSIKDLDRTYGIWGHSIGGAIAMQMLAINKDIRYGIIESSYAEFKTTVYDYSRNMTGFSIPFLNNYLIWRAKHIADFDPKKVDPVEFAHLVNQPVLIVHGEKDMNIKIEYDRKNFNNLASRDKKFIAVPNAGHSDIWEVAGDEYFNEVLEFINRVSGSKTENSAAGIAR